MAIKPIDSAPLSRNLLPPTKPGVTRSNASPAEAVHEERKRLASAQDEVKRERASLEAIREYNRDQFEKQQGIESARAEASLEDQRLKGYERIRDLQRAQNAEIARVRQEGEKKVDQIKNYYASESYNAERKGHDTLNQVQQQNTAELEYETKAGETTLNEVRANNTHKIARYQEAKDSTVEQAQADARRNLDQIRENLQASNQTAEQHYLEAHENLNKEQNQTLNRLNSKAQESLDQIRENNSRKVAAYAERQKDPFYRLVKFNAELFDNGDEFVLRAQVPEYEQRSVALTLKGNSTLVLSGHRKSEEKMESAPGRRISTSAYQAFQESFDLGSPVDPRGIRKNFDGDIMTAWIPKVTAKKAAPVYQAEVNADLKAPKVTKPKFPEEIEELFLPNGETGIAQKNRGTRTLG